MSLPSPPYTDIGAANARISNAEARIVNLTARLEGETQARQAAEQALARLRAKVGPVVHWWRDYRSKPHFVDIAGIAPVLAARLENLIAGWED